MAQVVLKDLAKKFDEVVAVRDVNLQIKDKEFIVIEGFGPSGFGAHSNDAEYVKLETIVPRLYLSARMIMDVAQDKAK